MRAGDFASAWTLSDRALEGLCRSGCAKYEGPRHLQRIWRGEELCGRRVLVRCYHGLGDTIQYARFLPALRRIAGEVVVWCQPELLPLIETVEGVDGVLPLHDGTPEAEFDADIEIMEIPHAIRASRTEIDMRRPYLITKSSAGLTAYNVGSGLSVGLVWGAGPWDHKRSVPAELLKTLRREGLSLYSLQRGPASEMAASIGAVDISTPDIPLLADRLRMLDLCICPDTMVAHLSAALGRETWIMLRGDCDWRWPVSGTETIWYPTARLFRQPAAGDWQSVVRQIEMALSERIGQRMRNR